MIKTIKIKRYFKNEVSEEEDFVIKEQRLNIFVNDKYYISLMCLPEHFEELTVGFLFSEGIINSYKDIESITSTCTGTVFVVTKDISDNTNTKKRVLVSGCAGGSVNLSLLDYEKLPIVTGSLKISSQELYEMVAVFNKQSSLFQETGGVHCSALTFLNSESLFYEDIGRHNAIDKIVGMSLIKDINIEDGILFTSGRISSEILIKTAKLGIPILVSRSAPTDMAVDISRKINMTLVGFARGVKFNVYSGDFRIIN